VKFAPNPIISINSPPKNRGSGNNIHIPNYQTTDPANNNNAIDSNTNDNDNRPDNRQITTQSDNNNDRINNNVAPNINDQNNNNNNISNTDQHAHDEITETAPARSRQYLISQFFRPNQNSHLSSRQRNVHQPDTTSNTIAATNLTTPHQTTTYPAPTQVTRTRKHYIQQHIMQKPIPNDYWGSSMDSEKHDSFRIYFQNINGITTGQDMERWDNVVSTMKDNCCEIFGLAETNTNWKSYNINNNLDHILRNKFSHSSTILSSNRFNPTNVTAYQPGGTLQTCTGHWVSRCIGKIIDDRHMGRWTGQTFQLKQQKTLSIITAYRPCKRNNVNNKSTSSSTYRQQTVLLMEEGIDDPDPRQMFIDDMITLINNLKRKT
jgi:hypothetical protein